MPITTYVRLTDEELLTLDGVCLPGTQAKVDEAKNRALAASFQWAQGLTPEAVKMIADAVAEAEATSRLRMVPTRLRHCSVCGVRAGYAKYKSGPNKGLDNLKKPLTRAGYDLANRSVTVVGSAAIGCCRTCFDGLEPHLIEALTLIRAALPPALVADGATRLVILRHVTCECGWTGSPADLAPFVGALTKCPSCDVPTGIRPTQDRSYPTGPTLRPADGFTLVPAEPQTETAG